MSKDKRILRLIGREHQVHPIVGFRFYLMRLRSRVEMTQEQLAEASDLHWRYLQTLERGKSNPSLKVLWRLRKGLKCSWDELLGKCD